MEGSVVEAAVDELDRFADAGGQANDGEAVFERTVVADKLDEVEFSLTTLLWFPGTAAGTVAAAAATAANSSSAFLIKSKSLNELKVLLLSFSLEIDSQWLDGDSNVDFSELEEDLFEPLLTASFTADEEYFSEF